MREALDDAIVRTIVPVMDDVAEALRSGDLIAVTSCLEGAFMDLRDDLVLYPAPPWLASPVDEGEMVRRVCARIAMAMRSRLDGSETSGEIERSARDAADRLLREGIEVEGLRATLEAMRRQADALGTMRGRMKTRDLSYGLATHLCEVVLARLDDYAILLSRPQNARAIEIGMPLLLDVLDGGTSIIGPGDMRALGLGGRGDRRGVRLAAHLMERAIALSADALDATRPDTMRMCVRIAASGLRDRPGMEAALRARLTVLELLTQEA